VAVDGERVMTSREALVMKKLPESIVIVGAGAIGVEFAYFLNAFGCKVTLVEMLPQVLPVEDAEVATALERSLKKQGIAIHVATQVKNIKVTQESVAMDLAKGDDPPAPVEAESLLLAIGVVANTEGLLSSEVELDLDQGYIKIDDRYESSVRGIYAAGDIIGPPWLAHVASFEAIQAVNGMFNHSTPRRLKEFPGCTYCQPQVASIGMTEKAVKEKGIPYKVGKFPFMASGKAVAVNRAEGFVKLITSEEQGEEHGKILGAHIIGAEATELIAEYGLALKLGATAENIHHTIHAHPTMSEALGEAAAATSGEAIHI
ncbi:MAG: FAD-dependent oxidoreductase, partial [Deltaproteobacteria bacterium]|nr:FAD-dependent oxidoreductase [Deltaproteobacteria bacterium]